MFHHRKVTEFFLKKGKKPGANLSKNFTIATRIDIIAYFCISKTKKLLDL